MQMCFQTMYLGIVFVGVTLLMAWHGMAEHRVPFDFVGIFRERVRNRLMYSVNASRVKPVRRQAIWFLQVVLDQPAAPEAVQSFLQPMAQSGFAA